MKHLPRSAIVVICTLLASFCAAPLAQGAFGAAGKSSVNLGAGFIDRAFSDGQGGTLIPFESFSSPPSGPELVRVNARGNRIRSFAEGGHFDFDVADAAVQRNGRIVLVGRVEKRLVNPLQSGSEIVVARVFPNGSPDRSFGNGGSRTYEVGSGPGDGGTSVAIARDGSIWVGGYSSAPASRFSVSFPTVLHIRSNGRPIAGSARELTGEGAGVEDVAIEPNGDALVLAVGKVYRFRPDGSFVRSFGTGGVVTLPSQYLTNRLGMLARGAFIVVRPEAGVGGTATRYRPNGRIDRAYGKSGFAEIAYRGAPTNSPESFVTTRDGRLIAAVGFVEEDGARRFGAVALRSDGSPDRSFGNGGQKLTGFPGESRVAAIVRTGRNKVTLVGTSHPDGAPVWEVNTVFAQLSLNGRPVR